MANADPARPEGPRSADEVRVEMLDLCEEMATHVLDTRACVVEGQMHAASRCASKVRDVADAASVLALEPV